MEIDIFGNVIAEEVEEVVVTPKISPFDYTNSISSKVRMEDLGSYNEYLTNLSFSQRNDTVMYANEMNLNSNIPAEAQYDFYFYGLPKKKYFAKWAKATDSKYLDAIVKYYNVSKRVAKEYDKILSDMQKKDIQKHVDTMYGGVRK